MTHAYFAISIRVLVALFTRTYFQPDEYFQSLEPAHHLVFGYGHLTWEWLARKPIRSILYPMLNVPIYWILSITGLSEAGALGDWLLVGVCGGCPPSWLTEMPRSCVPRYSMASLQRVQTSTLLK